MIHLLVDYENVHYTGLVGTEYLSSEDSITIFYSKPCKYIPNYRMQQILESGCKFEICELVRKRKNALDFYIATKVGEILTENSQVNVAIVSKDNGFKSVRDYWNRRLTPTNRLVKNDTISACIISSAEPIARKMLIQSDLQKVELTECLRSYEDLKHTERVRKELKNSFVGTEYEKLIPQIVELFENSNGYRSLYLNSIKELGKNDGLTVYRKIKYVL